jgi:hypothetical protein
MLLKRTSTAVYISEQGKPLVIMAGKLTPNLLFDFENGTYSYFSFKDVKPEREVQKIAGGLQDGRIQTWYQFNYVKIDVAGFTTFMTAACESWLKPGWQQEVKLLILNLSQGTTLVTDWIMLLESTNMMLEGHPCKLSTNDLHNHIQSHVHTDTMTTSTQAKLYLEMNYEKYKCDLKVDDVCVCAEELLKNTVKALISNLPSNNCHSASTHTTTSVPTVSSSASSINSSRIFDRIAPLSLTKHALLAEHQGCFYCHYFYVDHTSPNCQNGFLDKASYVTLNEADALLAKKRLTKKERAMPAAAVVPTTSPPVISTVVVMPSVVFGEGSDSECVSAPFSVPHFFPDCVVGGFVAEVPVRTLIDNGSDLVQIDSVLTD